VARTVATGTPDLRDNGKPKPATELPMPTIFSHVAVPLAIGLGLGAPVISRRLLGFGIIASILPDFDVVAFKLGIAYADGFGHRGASHSLLFALLLALCACLAAPALGSTRKTSFTFIFLATVSHGLFDMFTNGGLGIGLLWPYSEQRFFMPWQVIEVSPIGTHFFSPRALPVLMSELLWVWLPMFGLFLACIASRALWRMRNLR
jgi:inner membrane protein